MLSSSHSGNFVVSCGRSVLEQFSTMYSWWHKGTGLIYLCPDDLKLHSGRDSLNRSKLTTDVDAACKAQIRQSRSDPNISAGDFTTLLATEKDSFAAQARGYFVFLLETMLRDIHPTADVVHGLVSFDPRVLTSLPMNQVTFCFGALFRTFCLRGWVQRS